eukprot:CCRYP_015221-RA/>CCRYP_015221-RA protein AED:0.02 eAED:0.02 QI:1662/1/1/1/1/0.66/3/96/695
MGDYPPRTALYIDARYIVATYKAAISAGSAFYNPRGLLFKLLADFSMDNGVINMWSILDVLGVISIASVTDDERISTAGLLNESIQQHQKNCLPCYITKDLLLAALSPNILHNFRQQLLCKLSRIQRLKMLQNEEVRFSHLFLPCTIIMNSSSDFIVSQDVALRCFINQSKKIGLKRMIEFRQKRVQKLFIAWRLDSYLSRRVKHQMKARVTATWRDVTHWSRLAAFFETFSKILYYQSLMRRSFIKWKICRARMVKIKRCFVTDAEKRIRCGMGYVRCYIASALMRDAIATWLEFVQCNRKEEMAVSWNENNVLRRAFLLYREFSNQEINERNSERQASIQMELIQEFVHDIHTKSPMNKSNQFIDHQAAILNNVKKQVDQYTDAQRRKNAIQRQIDADIISHQRIQQRERAERDIRKLEYFFGVEWALKQSEALSAGEKVINTWMKSAEFADLCLKKEKEVKRVISMDSMVGTELDHSVCSRSVISYSILDGHLACASICGDEFFHCLPTIATGFDPFQKALDSCNVVLDTDHALDIFNDFHLELPAKSDESLRTKEVAIKDLSEYRRLSDKYVAPEGSFWKMYVCPFKQELVFHNISTNEKIFESNLRKKDVKRIVKENFRSSEIMKVSKDLFHQRCKAHQLMIKQYRAKQIQSMYRQVRGKRRIKNRSILVNDEFWCQLSLEECVTRSIAV